MKLADAIEGGITGATTLSLLQEALHKIDQGAPRPFLHKSGILKQLKNNSEKKDGSSGKLYIKLATELMSNMAAFGLAAIGKKKNVILRGGILGAAAGLGSAYLQHEKKHDVKNKSTLENGASVNGSVSNSRESDTKRKLLTVAMYTAGGLLAGVTMKELNKQNKKLKKKKISKLLKGKNKGK